MSYRNRTIQQRGQEGGCTLGEPGVDLGDLVKGGGRCVE